MLGIPYHFLVVHFPLVLILFALFYDWGGSHDIGYRLTLASAWTSLAAIPTGLMLAGGRLSQMTVHAGAALTGSFLILILAMLRYSRNARESESAAEFPATWLVVETAAALCIVVAAITGHRAVLGF